MRLATIITVSACSVLSCGPSDRDSRGRASDPTTAPAPGSPEAMTQGPGGEMIPLPQPVTQTSKDDMPTDPEGLRKELERALKEGRQDDAASIADVILVLTPDDPPVLELRARALEAQSDSDGAQRDRRRCCELGRSSCCE